MAAKVKARSLFDKTILIPAIGDSCRKLDPRLMVRNPVMFVAMVGAIVTTAKLFYTPLQGGSFWFFVQIALWLWFTVLFANFAEAMAEGRGKAQAATLRKARTQAMANRRLPNGALETIPAESLRKNDIFVVKAGEMIPADGEIIEGAATVDESAITGESAPVIREAGGDRSAVTGGTRVLPGLCEMPDSNPHAGRELFHAKRLGQIIIRARVQARHFLGILAPGRNHNNGGMGPFSNPPDNLQAVDIGKSQV